MNLTLSDEQVLLREAARGTLSRVKTLEAARAALEHSGAPVDLWAVACEAGWPGLLIDEERGGAGLDAFDAMLVMGECGRVLASVPLLGHLPATAILNGAAGDPELMHSLASGERRAAFLPAMPPSEVQQRWSTDPRRGLARGEIPRARHAERSDNGDMAGAGEPVLLTGTLAFVPDAPNADVLVGAALLDGEPVGVLAHATSAGVSVEPAIHYDATRSLGHVTLQSAPASVLEVDEDALASAWHLAQALIAAESIGAVESALEVSVAYAKERHTFGRPIGSYQAVKHSLTEVLRQLENGRSLLYYAGWSRRGAAGEFPLAANAARSVAGRALSLATRTMISVHGGIGATWEHDAPFYFRRAQLSGRLLGGTSGASDRVAGELIAQASPAAA